MPVTEFSKPLLYTISNEDTVLRDLLFSYVTNTFNTLAGLGIPVNPYDPATPNNPNPIVIDNCQISSGPAVILSYANADHTDYTTDPFYPGGNDPDIDRPRNFLPESYFGHYPHQRFAIRDNMVLSFMDIFLKGDASAGNIAKLVDDSFLDVSVFHKNLPGNPHVGLGGCE